MTVTYYPHIATVQKGVLFRLLLRWKGSLYKLVLPEIVVFLMLYLTLSVIYRCALNIEQKQSFESLCKYLRSHLNATSITFSLGFFVSYVMNRWWETFKTMPWLYTPAYVIREVVRPLHSPADIAHNSDSKSSLHNHSVQPPNKVNNNLHQPNGVTAEQQNVANDMISANAQKVVHSQEVLNCVSMNLKGLTNRKISNVVSPAIVSIKATSPGITVAGSAAHLADARRQADEDAMSVRVALMRYLLLGWIFAIRRISKPVMVRFMPPGKFVDATLREKLEMLNADPYIQRFVDPLITNEEQDAIMAYARLIQGNDAATYEPDHYVPLSWAADLVHEAYQRGLITSRHLVNELLSTFKEFRGGLGMLRFMDQFNIPLVYTQVVALSMYMYFVVLCFSEQFLEKRPPQLAGPSAGNETVTVIAPPVSYDDMDYYVPWPSVLYLTFVLGWLRVAEVCLNPFGEDDDDFPTWQILNMNLETAYKIIHVYDIDRVYDGSLREHRARRGAVITMGNNNVDTASHQRAQRIRRVSAVQGRSRRPSFNAGSSTVISPHLHEKDSVSHHGKLSDADGPISDDELESECSDAFSSYFNEQLETVRRSNYEHMRKKYERPIYQGSAIESEIGQNPTTSNSTANESVSGMTRNMSRLSNMKHQLGSALHLPSLQRYSSRSTVANTRNDLPEDSSSHVLIVPDGHSQSTAAAPHKRSALTSGFRRESAVASSTQQPTTGPWWRRVSESHTPSNHESLSTAASPSMADQRKVYNDDKLRPPVQVASNYHSSHPQLSELDVTMTIVGGRSSSHVELSQAARDTTTVAQAAAKILTSSATPANVPVVQEDPAPASQPSTSADLNSAVFIVGSRRNLNRIVETAENEGDAQSQLGKRKTDGRRTDSETDSSASDSNIQTSTDQPASSTTKRSLSDAGRSAHLINTPLIVVEQPQENQQSTNEEGTRSSASISSPGPHVYFEADS